MDYTNAIHIIPDAAGPDAWANAAAPPGGDAGIWATEDDYSQWNADSGLSGDGYGGDRNSSQPQSRAGSEQLPPGKKSGGGGPSGGDGAGSTSKSRAIGKMFFKKFYTEEGCPYGDACTFLHDEQSKARESVVISLSPSVGGGSYNSAAAANGPTQKPSNWKTRICNKWEMTGYCPFGSKCHFAHGAAELHKYGGGLVDMDSRDAASTPDSKQAAVSAKAPAETASTSTAVPLHADVYHLGAQSQRSTIVSQRSGKCRGPFRNGRALTRSAGSMVIG